MVLFFFSFFVSFARNIKSSLFPVSEILGILNDIGKYQFYITAKKINIRWCNFKFAEINVDPISSFPFQEFLSLPIKRVTNYKF